MTRFIQLTHVKGFKITLNANHITWFNQFREGDQPTVAIRLNNSVGEKNGRDIVYVTETYGEVRDKLSIEGLL